MHKPTGLFFAALLSCAASGQGIVIDLYQNIVSGNIGEDFAGTNLSNPPSPRGRVASAGYNLVGTSAFVADFTADGDRTGITDPGITRLRFDGGSFPTYTLATNSPARDSGDPTPENDAFLFSAVWLDNLLETDQRRNGFARTIGGRTDIGSIEFDPATPVIIPPNILAIRGNTLTFASIPGRHYILEVSEDLTYFIRLNKPFTATSTLSALADPTATSGDRSRFYRIAEVQQ